jgi:hypothetical protein
MKREGKIRKEINNKRSDEEKETGAIKIKHIMEELKLTYTNDSPEGFSYNKFQKFTAFN